MGLMELQLPMPLLHYNGQNQVPHYAAIYG
jgi:hypothetical protein